MMTIKAKLTKKSMELILLELKTYDKMKMHLLFQQTLLMMKFVMLLFQYSKINATQQYLLLEMKSIA